MTTSNHDDDDAMRDPRFDTAWRAASRETPPPALDDAIRAAARREVGAGPLRERTAVTTSMRAKVREATRPEKWWGPLAAAAVIGAIAVGVLQLAPQDRDPSADGAKAVVSDMPADAGTTRRDARVPAAASAPLSTGSEPERKQQSSTALAETSIPKSAPAPFPRTVVPTPSVPKPASPAPAAAPPLPAPASAPQPFPAETFKRGVAAGGAQAPSPAVDAVKPDVSTKEEAFAVAPRNSAGASATGAMSANATAPADPDALRDKLGVAPAPAAVGQTQAAGGAVARERAGSRSDSPSLAAAPAAMPQRDATAEPARQFATAKVAAERRADPAVDAKAKERARLPVADWIALIRKLRDEGRLDDVALELKAFRAVHADAQTLLPPDLRDAPPGTR